MKTVGPTRLHEGMPEPCPYCGAAARGDRDRVPCRHLVWFEVCDARTGGPKPRWDESLVRATIRQLAGASPSGSKWVVSVAQGPMPGPSATGRWRAALRRLAAWAGSAWNRWRAVGPPE